MKRHDYIIVYDIASPKRLQRIARAMAKECYRFQYSAYVYYDATPKELKKLLKNVLHNFDPKEDDIRVYRIRSFGIGLGAAYDLKEPFLMV